MIGLALEGVIHRPDGQLRLRAARAAVHRAAGFHAEEVGPAEVGAEARRGW